MTSPLVDQHRQDLGYLIGLAQADLFGIWTFPDDRDATALALMDVLPDLVDTYGQSATALGADWYEETRDNAGVPGRFPAVPATLPDKGRTDALAWWGTQFTVKFDPVAAQEKVMGGLQRIIANADRQTVMESAVKDPKAKGWKRVGSGKCEFCRMLIGRGAVYTEATAQFKSHDHCGCSAVPVWS